jgi:hypothetical protein
MARPVAIQADALVVKVTPHFGQRTWVELIRRSSAGGIWYPHCEQGVASDAFTFSRLIFFLAGIRGFYSEAVRNRVNECNRDFSTTKANEVRSRPTL